MEVVRGGRYTQGTFVSYDLCLEYTSFLSKESHQWFITEISSDNNYSVKDRQKTFSFLDLDQDSFKGKVRTTLEGLMSVYDAIEFTTGLKDSKSLWNRDYKHKYPEVVAKCHDFQFPGRGQRPTPVATLQVFLEILTTLPGRIAAKVREQAVSTLIRAMNGDLTLVEEIMDRISSPEDLRAIEELARARRLVAYGEDIPVGTVDIPITELTPELKNGYGWKNKTPQMLDLLVDLATHVGDIVIQRDSPHRPYSSTGKGGKSRIIPLTLKSIRDLNTLYIYWFDSTFIDDTDVVEVFQKRAYPEIAYRDFKDKGIKLIVANIISPSGITQSGLDRLRQIQKILDKEHKGAIQLNSMRLDEMVWGYMYPAIAERYQDSFGKFATHNLNFKVKSLCTELCKKKTNYKALKKQDNMVNQLNIFDLITSA